MNNSVTLSLTPSDSSGNSSGDVWLNMEQGEVYNALTMGGVYEMWVRAKSGISARTYNPEACYVDIVGDVARFTVYFNVFPSSMSLQYSLIASFGELSSDVEVLDRQSDFPVFFDKTDNVSFDRIYLGTSYSWQTPCYLSDATPISIPPLAEGDTCISTDEAIFLVGRGSGREQGYTHSIDFEIPLVDEDGNSIEITSIDSTITASWEDNGEIETTQLKLDVPQCILDALKLCDGKPNLICHKCEGRTLMVYYSTCEYDTVIETRYVNLYEKGEDTWCLPE